MDPTQHDNPYESPREGDEAEVSPNTVLERASLAWVFPLIGFLTLVGSGFLLSFPSARVVSIALLVASFALWGGGIMMTVYGVLASRQHPHAIGHALIGGVCSLLFTGSIVLGLFNFAYQVRH